MCFRDVDDLLSFHLSDCNIFKTHLFERQTDGDKHGKTKRDLPSPGSFTEGLQQLGQVDQEP